MKKLPDFISGSDWVPLDVIQDAIGPMKGSGRLPHMIRQIYNALLFLKRERERTTVTVEFSLKRSAGSDLMLWEIKDQQ